MAQTEFRSSSLVFGGFTFRPADGLEIPRVLSIRRTIYEKELGASGIDEFDAVAHHLIATTPGNDIASACRIITRDPYPLEIESFLSLDQVFSAHDKVAQIGGFWVQPDYRRVTAGQLLQIGMLKFVLQFCRSISLTQLILRTHVDGVRRLYGRIGFKERSALHFVHPTWGPVFVMTLDLKQLISDIAQNKDPVLRRLSLDDS